MRVACTLALALTPLLVACDWKARDTQSAGTASSPAAETRAAAGKGQGRATYDTELAALNTAIDKGRQLSARNPEDGLLPLEIVSLYIERARLTGDYGDYANAEALLAERRSQPGGGSSACLVHARLNFAVHRLAQARAALDACAAGVDRAEIAAIRADLAFYGGAYKEADESARLLVNRVGLSGHFVRLALMKSKLGAPGEATAFLEAAEKRYHGGSATMKAWLKLQRGLIALDRGRLDEALALYRLADAELPGWWLVEEHIAEVQWLSGKTREARTLYDTVVRKTQAPEYLDALAQIVQTAGQADEAQKLTAQARALYEERLRKFPEAAVGHALDHYLADAADAPRALELAQANFRTRPYGDAAIALAKAWNLNRKPEAAVPLLESELARGWDTAELYWTLFEVLDASGNAQRAALMKGEALRRNPHSARMYGGGGAAK